MEADIVQVDAFTSERFRGNPAGVCLLGTEPPEDWMQAVAAEMNLSETAFLWKRGPGSGYGIRYFTPACEVSLCGHATLSSAHVLYEQGMENPASSISFEAPGGSLGARREGDWICLDFPALEPIDPPSPPQDLAESLGAGPRSVWSVPNGGYLAELKSDETVRSLRPDFALMAASGIRSVIATAACEGGPYDFVSRFFAPGVGINEDPVTGVAHCSLGPYWAKKTGRTELTAYQASRRGGVVRVRVKGDRVELLGQAVTVIRGRIIA